MLITLAEGTDATVSEERKTAAPAATISPAPKGMPYSRAMNTTAIAWKTALPPRLSVAASGSTNPETGRGSWKSLSAASIMRGSAAIDDVAENPISIDGYEARRNRSGDRRAMKATAGRYTSPMNSATPMITAAMNQSIARIRLQPNCVMSGATSAKMPIGANSNTQ